MYQVWTDMVRDAGVVDCGRLSGVTVRSAGCAIVDDVVLCPASNADDRIRSINASSSQRRTIPERVFMARALRNDAETATAILVRAVIGRWVHARGRRDVEDQHERRAWTVLDNHLRSVGQCADTPVTAGRQQIAEAHIRPPVAHRDAADVVRKAMAQIARQIDGRHVIVMGGSPLAV